MSEARQIRKKGQARRRMGRHWQLYLLLLIPLIFLVIFKYMPMAGLQIAFRDYNPGAGIWSSPFVGLKHFRTFFKSHEFKKLLSNTLILGFGTVLCSIPFPIALGLAINASRHKRFAKTVQMVTYAPYFISSVILVTIITQFLAVRGGMLNNVLGMLGIQPVNLMASAAAFRPIYILSHIWQQTGYGAVVYIAALSGVNPELYEAAMIDGASAFQRIRHIDLPSITPVAIILLIMSCGSIINVSYEKVLLLQNPMNSQAADVINTYVYRIGISSAQYSYSAAIGMFNSVVAIALLLAADFTAKKLSDISLF